MRLSASTPVALALSALAACVVMPHSSAAMPATKACADPALPRSILAGEPPSRSRAELRTINVVAPRATLHLAVADTPRRRELGLMCVTALKQRAGMIFVFPDSGTYEFWMKNTLLPLDMVWLDAVGRVTAVARAVPASTLDEADDAVARRSGTGRYVIELRAHEAAGAGLAIGEHVTLPRLQATE